MPHAKLRIYLGEAARHGHEPLYKAVVERLRARGIAGATVFRGVMGYGQKNAIHRARAFALSQDVPVVVEAIDAAAAIEAALPEILALVQDGLVTVEDVTIVARGGDAP